MTLQGRSRWLIMPVLALGVSLIVIDGTIVNVALPEIIDALQMDLSEAEWTNSLYALVFAALLIAVGATADKFGRRRLFVAGVVVFASVMACGPWSPRPAPNRRRRCMPRDACGGNATQLRRQRDPAAAAARPSRAAWASAGALPLPARGFKVWPCRRPPSP